MRETLFRANAPVAGSGERRLFRRLALDHCAPKCGMLCCKHCSQFCRIMPKTMPKFTNCAPRFQLFQLFNVYVCITAKEKFRSK